MQKITKVIVPIDFTKHTGLGGGELGAKGPLSRPKL